ncbi:MAG: hypothetical protein CVU42_11870 [Chloroflexi bacterium HGW-Chloroflexi-4]|nr:MAG: hypothetical protein CVU42_11870 [Chloroflexi bacterium HGW-Chloroflexi-4]
MSMNEPVLVILIGKFEEKLNSFLRSVINNVELDVIFVDTTSKRSKISNYLRTKKLTTPTTILHATKSKAVLTGLKYFDEHFKESSSGLILVDMDQGFGLDDINAVVRSMDNIPDAIIIGGREIEQIGNKSLKFIISRLSRLTGTRVKDFNSGLRGLPASFVSELLNQKPTHLDTWIEMYVFAAKNNNQIVEVPIQTQHQIKSSILFSFILNSSKLFYIILRFSFLSMLTAGIDYAIFSVLFIFSNSILASIIIARIAAGSFQFFMGKKWVFKSRNRLIVELIKYIILVGVLMLISYTFIELMVNNFGMNAIVSKLIAELSLFIVSFTMQKKIVFAHPIPTKH